ncbi:hypothetical protein F2P81_026213 [Scophthalmus maximus]|uniref:Uncharacterized protein n=1 Tax=Scophthalmus maximus TaxID=52904 RepID=A0A6A4RSE3_SCOMX|nr:hypothetical protein F2P81_026213 [Scophthalmus maximus]
MTRSSAVVLLRCPVQQQAAAIAEVKSVHSIMTVFQIRYRQQTCGMDQDPGKDHGEDPPSVCKSHRLLDPTVDVV